MRESRISSWLVALLALVARPNVGAAFCPLQWRQHSKRQVVSLLPWWQCTFCRTRSTKLHVSKKKKKGRVNAAAVKEAAQDAARQELQRALSAEKERLQDDNNKTKVKPAAVAKTVRNLLHDAEQNDITIDDEARLLAAYCYNAAGRYSDTLALLSGVSGKAIFQHDSEYAWIGLEANAATEKWRDAVEYADILLDKSSFEDGGDLILNDEARSLAIQSYANAHVDIEKAIQLLKSSHNATPDDYNVVLRSLLEHSNKAQEAADLYRYALEDNVAEATSNAETHRIALQVAANLEDTLLAQKGIARLDSSLEDKPYVDDLVNALLSCAGTNDVDTSFAVDLLHRLEAAIGTKNNVQVENCRALMKVISRLMLSEDLDGQQLLCMFDLSQRFRGEVMEWLSTDARAAVLPILDDGDDEIREEQAEAVFESLHLTPKSLSQYAKVSSGFWTSVFCRCVKLSLENDNMYNVAKRILAEDYPLNPNATTMLARAMLILAMAKNRKEISTEAAIQQVDEILKSVSFDNGLAETGDLWVEGNCILMLLYSRKGDAGAIDTRYTVALGHGLSNEQKFELLRSRYEALTRAYHESDEYDKLLKHLFPEELGKRERVKYWSGAEAVFKVSELFDSVGSVFSRTKSKSSMLGDLMRQAILCDETTGGTSHADDVLTLYHEIMAEAWKEFDVMYLFFAEEFPTVRPAYRSNTTKTKFDELNARLWGDECRRAILNVMIEGDCEKGWMIQTGGQLNWMVDCLEALYSTPVLNHESIRADYRRVRQQSVRRIVELLLEQELAKTQTLSKTKSGKKKKSAANDFVAWSSAVEVLVPVLWPSLLSTVIIRDKETDARNSEALSIARNVLVTHPSVKSMSREMLDSYLRETFKRSNPVFSELSGTESLENIEDLDKFDFSK